MNLVCLRGLATLCPLSESTQFKTSPLREPPPASSEPNKIRTFGIPLPGVFLCV